MPEHRFSFALGESGLREEKECSDIRGVFLGSRNSRGETGMGSLRYGGTTVHWGGQKRPPLEDRRREALGK